MAQRTVALCNGKYIGIESIYTVVNGNQINIPYKLINLREKSRSNKLFCPCGCGANLILVAGDKNLREQHFRIKDGTSKSNCTFKTEGKESVESKIVLKCWLDDKLQTNDIETRIPIYAVENNKRKYEFSFLSKEKKIALSYCHDRRNLSDEKFDILDSNSQNIHLIYVVDIMNENRNWQYPEGLMKIQNKQGYCLLLSNNEGDYSKAKMRAICYRKDVQGIWYELIIASGLLKDYGIWSDGTITYSEKNIMDLLERVENKFQKEIEKKRRYLIEESKRQMQEQEERKRRENQRRIEEQKWKEEQRFHEQQEAERKEKEEKQRQIESAKREEDFKKNMESGFKQQDTPIRDAFGNRWIKCEFCGEIAKEEKFVSYGGAGHINLGTCKQCAKTRKFSKIKVSESVKNVPKNYDPTICPECGGKLRERHGIYGGFLGCSNYPKCKYTRR